MYCPNCKNKALENSATCFHCGYDLSKHRKIKVDEEDQPNRFDDRIFQKPEYREALKYDPFKDKIKVHLITSGFVLAIGIALMIILFATSNFFAGTFGTVLSIICIIMVGGGFLYTGICIFLFLR